MTEPGNSCHIHASLWRGTAIFSGMRRAKAGSKLFRQFLGGLIEVFARALLFLRADDQRLQTLSGRRVGRRQAGVVARQSDGRLSRRGGGECLPDRKPHARRRRQSVSGFRGDIGCRHGGSGGRPGLRRRLQGQRLR